MIKIVHLTSVHTRYDTRIFIKMCRSLAKNENYEVCLVVADGKDNELKNGVHIIDTGRRSGSRVLRMTQTVRRVFKKAKELKGDIYHLHDPELMPVGLKLKKLGYKVIFDAHEDLPKQILSKPYVNKRIQFFLSKISEFYERYACKRFDYIIAATPYIKEKFAKINKKSIDVNNFPVVGELSYNIPWSARKDEICYVGAIAEIRGIKEIVKAIEFTENVELNLAGTFCEKSVRDEVKNYKAWQRVNELGFVSREEVAEIMKRCKAGLVTLYPISNYLDALPVKMFEYMSAGLPVIASDFMLWREIIEANNCGICVNPSDPKEIADAIRYIVLHPKESEIMGENGKKAVMQKYNWEAEERKLFYVYEHLSV